MAKNDGWINIHRALLKNPVNKSSHAMHIWLNLLLGAHWNKNPKEVMMTVGNGLRSFSLQRGQCIFYKNTLSEEMNISKNTLNKYLTYFEENDMIETLYSGRFTHIRIIKWEQYQR